MVKVLVAPDKFKGSLTALEVCDAVTSFFSTKKKFEVSKVPLADGGEGTFEMLLTYYNGFTIEVTVHDPLMRKIRASYGISKDGSTAFIEMAKASGLQLLKKTEYDPRITTTFGTGELIAHALDKGVQRIILGIGGSATHDAGTGMASALGFAFYTNDGQRIDSLTGNTLGSIARIERSDCHKQLSRASVITLCDVKNPLTGKTGAAAVFAPQKGATPADVAALENGMRKFEMLLNGAFGFNTGFEGAGAAGGLGAGAAFFLNTTLTRGIDFLADITSLEEKVASCDVVITGEGKLDAQSLSGKVVEHVASLAKKYNKKVIVICGMLDLTEAEQKKSGIDECLILSRGMEVERSINNAAALIKERLQESKIIKAL